MGNYLGVPSSTQVSFPPPPFPTPVARPPIIPPMRQLDIGLGPPSPFQPGRTPLPMMIPSLANRPPLVQPDGVQILAPTHTVPGNVNVRGPIDQILINKQINRTGQNGQNQQQQQIYTQANGQVLYEQIPVNQLQQTQVVQQMQNQNLFSNQAQANPQLIQQMNMQQSVHPQQLINQQLQGQPQIAQQSIIYPLQSQNSIIQQQIIYPNQGIPQQMIEQQQFQQLHRLQQIQQLQQIERLQQLQQLERLELQQQQSQIPLQPQYGLDSNIYAQLSPEQQQQQLMQQSLVQQQLLQQQQFQQQQMHIRQQLQLQEQLRLQQEQSQLRNSQLRSSQIRQSQPSIPNLPEQNSQIAQLELFAIQHQPHQLIQEQIPQPNLGSTLLLPSIQQIGQPLPSQVPQNQSNRMSESVPYQSQSSINNNPTPSIYYAKPAGSVPIIPPVVLETINILKQSRQIIEDSIPRGIPLEPYYIPQKQAYYEGEWINGLPGGHARIFYDSGAYFEGYFINGEAFCKEGIWVYPDGSYYIGGIAHSTPNGLGQLVYKGKGMRYIGNWMNGKPNGQGREQFQDGSFYDGTFVNGVKEGYGKFIWSNGSFYEGQFKNGFMEGHGTKQFSNGSKFTGEFKKNKLFGKGIYLHQNGQYKGEFIDNKREGLGTFKYTDGRIYVGEFRNDFEQGRGKMFVPSGQVIEGEWRNGKNVSIHNISLSTSISDISLSDLGPIQNRLQIPDVPVTVSLQAQNTTIPPTLSFSNGLNSNLNQPTFHYSANYRPPSRFIPSTQNSKIIPQ